MAYGHADPFIAAFLQAQAGGMQSGAQAWQQHLEEQKVASQQQALADVLIGRQGSQPGLPGAAPGDVRGFTPSAPGALPGVDPRLIQAALLVPGGREALLQQAFAQPALPKPPETRNVLQGNERVFQQFDPNTGQWSEVGRGPAFAPPSQINVNTEKPLTGAALVTAALAPGAIADADTLARQLFNPDGTLNRGAVATMNTPLVGAIPGTAGVDLRQRMMGGIEAILRATSGAAITQSEADRRADMYMPSVSDTDSVARNKIERYARDLQNALGAAMRGHGAADSTQAIPPASPSEGMGDRAQRMLGGVSSAVQGAIGSAVNAAAPEVANIATMSIDQLTQLDASNMSVEQLQAAARRYDELSGAR